MGKTYISPITLSRTGMGGGSNLPALFWASLTAKRQMDFYYQYMLTKDLTKKIEFFWVGTHHLALKGGTDQKMTTND